MKKTKEVLLTERIVVIGIKESELKTFISKKNFNIHELKNISPYILEEYNSIHLVENKEENYKKDLLSVRLVITYIYSILYEFIKFYFSILTLRIL